MHSPSPFRLPQLRPPTPPPLAADVLSALIDQGYTKDVLARLYKMYLQPLFADRPASPFHNPKNPSKRVLVDALRTVFSHRELFLALMDLLPEAAREAVRLVVWYGPHSVRQMTHLLGVNIMVKIQQSTGYASYYARAERETPFLLLMVDVNSSEQQYPAVFWRATLYLPIPIRFLLRTYLPAPTLLQPTDETPATAFLYRQHAGSPARLVRAALFMGEGHLGRTTTGKPRKADLRRMQTYCEIPELFDDERGPYAQVATELLIDTLDQAPPVYAPDTDGLALLCQVLDLTTEAHFERSLADQYLSFLRRRDTVFDLENEQTARLVLMGLLSLLPPERWVSLDDLLRLIRYHALPVEPFDLYDARRYLTISEESSRYPLPAEYRESFYYYGSDYMTADLFDEAVTRPLLQGFLAHLAVLGLVDIAYDYPSRHALASGNKTYLTLFDGVRFVWLNPLGAYLAGLAETYEAPAESARPETIVTLNPDYLILTLEGDDKIKEMIAEEVGKKLGPGRYTVDYASFLRGCASRSDVQEKVERFRRHLCDDLPDRWAAFFGEVVRKVNPLLLQPDVQVFKLDGDAALIRLFARDPVLQKYARKAEDHHVLVEARHLAQVRKRLEQFGYLMPR